MSERLVTRDDRALECRRHQLVEAEDVTQDGEEAQETGGGSVGMRAGVFTNALLDTLRMPGMRDATFVATQTVREGDRPMGPASPDLKDDSSKG